MTPEQKELLSTHGNIMDVVVGNAADVTKHPMTIVRECLEQIAHCDTKISSLEVVRKGHQIDISSYQAEMNTCTNSQRRNALELMVLREKGKLREVNQTINLEECSRNLTQQAMDSVLAKNTLESATEDAIIEGDVKTHIMGSVASIVRHMRSNKPIGESTQSKIENLGLNVSMLINDSRTYLAFENEFAELDYLLALETKMKKAVKKWNIELERMRVEADSCMQAGDPIGHDTIVKQAQEHSIPALQDAQKPLARLAHLKNKLHGKVRTRILSGNEYPKFLRKTADKYYPVVSRKLRIMGLVS